MAAREGQLQEVYAGLGQILQRPEIFGLGPTVPRPLADSLGAMLKTLAHAMSIQEEMIPEEDLATELSQDADRPLSENELMGVGQNK